MKICVMIPTYNESQNIKNLIDEILRLKIKDLHIVVVDDNSPDKTWKIVKGISRKNKNVELLLRTKDKGRGSAGKAGFIYCIKKKADAIVEMDADFSHHPRYIPLMLKELKKSDVILGSRRVEGSRELGRSRFRKFVTLGANLYIRIMLRLKVKDCNSGFRCFKRKVLEEIKVDEIESKGPATDREKGTSKLGLKQLVAGYLMVMRLKFMHLSRKI